jgi:hypothetical protein
LKTFFVLSLSISVEPLMLNCDYFFYNWVLNPNSYICKATVLFLGHERNVVEVSKNHLVGKTNNDVVGLWIDKQIIVDFVPQNLTWFFPNIKQFTMSGCGLKTVSSYELKQFGPNQLTLGFHQNFIEQIDHDLFEFTPNVQLISFEGNKIRHIGYDAFETTPILAYLQLNYNFCISKTINNNATAIHDFKFELALKCPPTVEMLEAQLYSRKQFDIEMSNKLLKKPTTISQNLKKESQESRKNFPDFLNLTDYFGSLY